MDDASTDNTLEILKKFVNIDKRIKIYRNEKNIGLNLNFEKACKLTTGNFIAISDQDDIWEQNKISLLLSSLQEDKNVIMVHSISIQLSDITGKCKNNSHLFNYNIGNNTQNFFLYNFICGHNMLFRRKLLEKALPFPANVFYDWWLAIMAFYHGKIKGVPNILTRHRVHDKNASGAGMKKRLLSEELLKVYPHILKIEALKE